MVLEMIEIFRRPQQHTKANFQYNFIIQKTFKVCILSCQRASVPFSTGPGGKELRDREIIQYRLLRDREIIQYRL